MTVFRSETKGDLDRRRRKQPTNLLLDIIEESVPTSHLSKPERVDIVDFFKDLYQKYWANDQGNLVMVPAMDAADLTLAILSYTQHLNEIATRAQKTSDKNAWVIVQAREKLNACTEEIAALKEKASKKSPTSDEAFSLLLERAQKEPNYPATNSPILKRKRAISARLVKSCNLPCNAWLTAKLK